MPSVKDFEDVELKEATTIEKTYHIVVFNDPINSFDHVIETFIDVLGHNKIQAEQCAITIHLKGKSSVKTDTYEKLEPMNKALLSALLTSQIEEK